MLLVLASAGRGRQRAPDVAAQWEQAVFPAGYDLFITGRAGANGSLRDGPETSAVAAPEPYDLAPTVAA